MTARHRARVAYAGALTRFDRRMGNVARNIIDGGFENIWITPALDALEAALRGLPDEDEGGDSEEGGRA